MKKDVKKKGLLWVLVIYLLCEVAKFFEFFYIRTDETVFADNFLNKLFGIIVLFVAMKYFAYSCNDIGLDLSKFKKSTAIGLGLGTLAFIAAYSIEFIVLNMQDPSVSFELYVGGFSLTGNEIKNTGLAFFAMCILFNIINVVMEEGVFRGLFLNLFNENYRFFVSNILVALFFGIWHLVTPIRSYIDGDMDFGSMLFMSIGYVILSGLMSIKWGLLRNLSGALWIGMADHFVNNTLSNVLHVTTQSGTDELMIVRILVAQTISFIAVIVFYSKSKKRFMY